MSYFRRGLGDAPPAGDLPTVLVPGHAADDPACKWEAVLNPLTDEIVGWKQLCPAGISTGEGIVAVPFIGPLLTGIASNIKSLFGAGADIASAGAKLPAKKPAMSTQTKVVIGAAIVGGLVLLARRSR